MRTYLPVLCAGLIACASVAHAQSAAPLTLHDSVQRVLAFSPALKAKAEGIGGSRGDRQQSGLIPNPELSFDAENILGNGSAQGVKGAEMTLGVAQTVELGGKRGARIAVANRQVDAATLEYAAAGLDLVRDTTVAWAEAVAATEELRLAQEQTDLAAEVLQSVTRRVDAAAENAIQKSRAEVALASAKVALSKAERNRLASLKALSGLWGDAAPAESIEAGGFFEVEAPTGNATLDNNPDLRLLEAGVGVARANLEVERANAVPDVTFQAGVRDSRDADEQSFLAGVSIPFPAFNRNQGAIRKAGHEVTRAEQEKHATVNTLELDLVKAKNALETATAEINSFDRDILPSAEKAFAQARKGYQAGKFPYLEVLDAQRTLFDVRAQRIAALKEYHAAKADLDRLTGKHLPLIAVIGEKQ